MTQRDIQPTKPVLLRRLEYILLTICLCVLALRATYVENPHISTINVKQFLGNDAISLLISSALIISALAWLLCGCFCRKASFRLTGLEIPILIFFTAVVISTAVASNKRAAITDSVTLIAPMLMAVLLVQILDAPAKLKILLMVIVALAVVTAYICFNQFFTDNQKLIEDYQSDPQRHLERLAIEPGSFRQMLYEHRLNSKDIWGFLTTSNSTGSFLIFAVFAAVALFIEKLKNRRIYPTSAPLLWYGAAAVITIAGLIITQSKGAIIAAAVSAIMFAAALCFGKKLQPYRKRILIVLILLITAGVIIVTWYGTTHGSLPGGNSMLVRWQYWHATARMYTDHPLTGIGGGNFVSYYPHYKIASALETVSDPHNFILSLLTRYGPLGLAGFLAAFLIPLYKTVKLKGSDTFTNPADNGPIGFLSGAVLFSISVVTMLVIRPLVLAEHLGDASGVIAYVFVSQYVIPAAVFALAFRALWMHTGTDASEPRLLFSVRPALFCAVVAVIIANTIDFAIFEPAVLTCFWAIVASIIAINHQRAPLSVRTFALSSNRPMRIMLAVIAVVVGGAYFHYAVIPTVKASAKVQRANKDSSKADELLTAAAEDDPLSPTPLTLNGKLYLQRYNSSETKDVSLLQSAAGCFIEAVKRDSANFKNYEKLGNVYLSLATHFTGPEQAHWFRQAYDRTAQAAERYPGSGRMQFKLALTAEQLGQQSLAIKHYQSAVRIEDAYRQQFGLMYPGREMFSRLGEKRYLFAKQRIEKLSRQSD